MPESAPFFAHVPQRRPHWASLAISFGVQATAVLLLTQLGLVRPPEWLPSKKTYMVVPLVSVPPPQRAAVLPPKSLLPHVKPKLIAKLDPPRIDRPRIDPPRLPAPAVVKIAPVVIRPEVWRSEASEAKPVPSVPKPQIVRTGVFSSTGSQALPTLRLPARQVQTGGFGDPNGIKGEGKPATRATIARVGSFDLPEGPGYGNGTGGAHGTRGTVASVGFGNGIAIGNSDHNRADNGRHIVPQSGFANARPASGARVSPRVTPAKVTSTDVQVISKPNPVYTAEARALRLEGQVLLDVTFAATGQCRVHRVLRGLGHGLDESAIRAAQQIRFRPATRDGRPVDSTATLHVLFQLAY